MSSPEIRARVAASRAQQGFPPTVQDPAALERAAAALRVVSAGSVVPSLRRIRGRAKDREAIPGRDQKNGPPPVETGTR
jgi:hypothetical protein